MAGSNARNDLFNYDAGLDDILRESANPNTTTTGNDGNNNNNNAARTNQRDSSNGGGGLGLGLDEEVNITRKRAPIAKLDESRLLSQKGIPKLRSAAKKKLKLKGKGYEFPDAARLLTFYQLWLDDLYPRAKFEDGLSMVEKLGHSKRMQVMRREWIDEGKPRAYPREEDVARREDDVGPRPAEGSGGVDSGGGALGHGEAGDDAGGASTLGVAADPGGEQSLFGDGRGTNGDANDDDDDDGDDLFVADPNTAMSNPIGPAPDNAPGEEDDLDALLDGDRANGPTTSTAEPDPGSIHAKPGQSNEDAFDDDLDAMNAYGM